MRGPESADYYVNLAQEDYYLKGGEPPGQWYGEGADRLGLFGKVTESELKLLFSGRGPDKEPLVQNAGSEDRQAGWDLTFSAPKSVSVLWAQADPETRRAILEAHRASVDAALDYLEKEAAWTRRGKKGEGRERAHLVFAKFEHGTSRAQDPNVHTHVLLVNACVRDDGTTGSIESKPIFKEKMTAGALYRAEYAQRLCNIGFEVEQKRSWFEVKGVSETLIADHSKRRKEIEEELSRRGESGAVASKMATLNTRDSKEHLPREKLFALWAADGARHNFGPVEVENLKSSRTLSADQIEVEKRTGIKGALRRLTEHESHFTKRDFVRRLAEESQGRGVLGARDIQEIVRQELANSKEVVHLGRYKDEERYSTREMVGIEKRMMETVRGGKEKAFTVSERTTSAVLERRSLNAEQREAVIHLTRTSGAIQLVGGMAGTGKSYVMDAVREAYEKEGYRVLGAAPSGKAAAELKEQSGIESKTIHRLLGEIKRGNQKLDKNTVLIVDEAGMVGTRKMAELLEVVSQKKAKLILIGDEKQLQSVAAGGAFKAFSQEVGRKELKEIRRQKEEWAREAVYKFAVGDAGDALGEYAKRGLVSVESTRKKAITKLLEDWKQSGVEHPSDNLMLAGTNLDVHELNSKAQAIRFKEGKLKGDGIPLGNDRLYEGDRVLFTKNDRTSKVQNGQVGTIISANASRGSFTAKLDSGREVWIDTKRYANVALGYALTTHKAQGATVRNSFVLLGGGMQDRELSYVQASRAKETTRFYVDEVSAGAKLKDIVRQMTMSHQKELAVSVAKSPRTIVQKVIAKGLKLTR